MDKKEEKQQRVDLKVYDVPIELKNKYMSMAKLDYDNKMWKVLEAGMENLIDERNNKVSELEDEVQSLQKQIVHLKTQVEQIQSENSKDDKSDTPQTFGSTTEKEDDELLDKFDV